MAFSQNSKELANRNSDLTTFRSFVKIPYVHYLFDLCLEMKKTRGPWWPWVAHLSIIGTNLFQNLCTGLAEEVLYSFFLFIALAAILSTERHSLCNFGGQSPKEHSCIIISKSMHWLRRRSHLKVFLFLALVAILFNGADWFEKKLLDSHLRNIPVKLFQKLSTDLAEEVIKSLFLFIALAAILFNVAESFEQFW